MREAFIIIEIIQFSQSYNTPGDVQLFTGGENVNQLEHPKIKQTSNFCNQKVVYIRGAARKFQEFK